MTHTGHAGNGIAAPVPPLPVHITNAQELAGMGQREGPRKHVRSVFRTFVLTAASPVIPILAEDLSRSDSWVVAYGNSVVLCESQSQAQDPANQVAGTGAFSSTPANPQGTLLYVPSQAVAPVVTPAVPASTVGTENPYPFPVTVVISGGTITLVAVGSYTSPVGAGAGTYVVPAYSNIQVTYSAAPTWAWSQAAAPSSTPPVSVRWTLDTTEPVWATALAFPAFLALITHNRASGY